MKKLHPIRDLGAFVLGLGLIFTGSALTLTSCDNGSLNNNQPTNQTQDKTTEFKNKLAEFNQEVANPSGLGTKEKRVAVNKLYTELLGYSVSDELKTELKNSMLDFVISNYEVSYANTCNSEYVKFSITNRHLFDSDRNNTEISNTTVGIGPVNVKGLYINTTKKGTAGASFKAGEGSVTNFFDLTKILRDCKNSTFGISYKESNDLFTLDAVTTKDSSLINVSFSEYSLNYTTVNTVLSSETEAYETSLIVNKIDKTEYNEFMDLYYEYKSLENQNEK